MSNTVRNEPHNLRTQGLEAQLPLQPDTAFRLSRDFKAVAQLEGFTVPSPIEWRDPLMSVRYQTPSSDRQYKGKQVALYISTLPIVPKEAVATLFGRAMPEAFSEGVVAKRRAVMTSGKLLGSISEAFMANMPDELVSPEGDVQLDFTRLRSGVFPNTKGAASRYRIFELVPDTEQAIEIRYGFLNAIAEATKLKPEHPIRRAQPDSQNLRLAGLAVGAVSHIADKHRVDAYRKACGRVEERLGAMLLAKGGLMLTFGPLLFNPKHNPKIDRTL